MAFIDTYRGVAQPWLCDIMGHMNVRHYVGHFDDAGWHFLAELGLGPDATTPIARGWADVRATIEYKREVRMGELFKIKTGLAKIGRTSLVFMHQMFNPTDTILHATMEVVTVYFDLQARRATPLPDSLRNAAERLGCVVV